jgi:hypothetical protein
VRVRKNDKKGRIRRAFNVFCREEKHTATLQESHTTLLKREYP